MMGRVVAIVQARMNSTRLPGKILVDVAGRPMLSQQIRRLRACRALDEIMIATTTNSSDDAVVELARAEGVAWFRGDEHDVLLRYVRAAEASRADLVVRVTADCPLLDPTIADRVVERAADAARPCDYASNTIQRTFPRGLDVEAFHRDVLDRSLRLARSQQAREHVTYFLHRERPDLFVTADVVDTEDNSNLRWTVDTLDDLTLIRGIYEAAHLTDRVSSYAEILAVVRSRADLMALNAHIQQKPA